MQQPIRRPRGRGKCCQLLFTIGSWHGSGFIWWQILFESHSVWAVRWWWWWWRWMRFKCLHQRLYLSDWQLPWFLADVYFSHPCAGSPCHMNWEFDAVWLCVWRCFYCVAVEDLWAQCKVQTWTDTPESQRSPHRWSKSINHNIS